MRKITFLIALLITSVGFSQELLTNGDFQTGDGTAWSGNAVNVVTYDATNYFNEANVATAGDPFAVNISNVIPLTPSEIYTFSFDAWTAAGETRTMVVGIGLNEAPWTAETQTITIDGDSPQNFSFNLTAPANSNSNSRVIFDMGADTGYVGIDNVSLTVSTCGNGEQDGDETGVDCGGSCAPCPMPPSVAAPTPPVRNSGDVVALYSDAYAQSTNWGQIDVFGTTTLTDIMVAGDNTYELAGPPGGGYQYNYFAPGGTSEDLSAMTHYHVDVWVDGSVSGGEVFTVQLLNYDGSNALESNNFYQVPITTTGEWVSVDVPISSFVNAEGNTNYDNIRILQVLLQGPQFGPVYFDNLYFYRSNDTCADAAPIALDGNEITVSNIGATDSGVSASCDSGVISDVWYFFEATATGEAYFQTNAPNLSVWSGSCGSLTEIACNPGSNPVTGLVNGNAYYVRINDDGTARAPGSFSLTASDMTLGTDDFNSTDFSAYPNPTTDKWNIKTNGQDITAVQVVDMLGKTVMSITPNSNAIELDASALPAGLYFAKLSSENGTKSIKLVKQ